MCVVGPSPLLAEGPGCSSPPLLAGVCRLWWWLVARHSRLRVVVAVPRHSWLGFAAGSGWWSLATPGRGPWVWFPATPGSGPPVVVVGARSPLLAVGPGLPFSVALVCVCVLCGASCWCGWCAGVVCGVLGVCVCVCACDVCFVGYVIPGLVRVVSRHGQRQKKRSCRCVAELCVAHTYRSHTSLLSHRAFFPCRESVCRPRGGVCWVWQAGVAVLSFFFLPLCFLAFLYLFSLVA